MYVYVWYFVRIFHKYSGPSHYFMIFCRLVGCMYMSVCECMCMYCTYMYMYVYVSCIYVCIVVCIVCIGPGRH